jgi:GrpB-like predicted nucleotidyltransferase (UPF0157 family)
MMSKYPIQIVPYDASWLQLFEHQATALRYALDEVALRIDHIRSTAIPQLDAKPIIDIQISVANTRSRAFHARKLYS